MPALPHGFVQPSEGSGDLPSTPVRLLDRIRYAIRTLHYSYRTEQAYVDWIRRFVIFHGKRHPIQLGAPEVADFLNHLAVLRRVSAHASGVHQAAAELTFAETAQSASVAGLLDQCVRA